MSFNDDEDYNEVIYIDDDNHIYHMGLLGLSLFGGYRAKAYATNGASLSLHFGMHHRLSLLKLELGGYHLIPLDQESPSESHYIETQGLKGQLALTFIF